MDFDFSKLHFNSALLAKELMSRWVDLKLFPWTNTYEAKYKWHVEFVDDTDISLMPSVYRYILDDKWKTKQILNDKWFNVIKWNVFECTAIDAASEYAEKIWFPVVLKPRSWTHWYYVRMNIDSKDEFEEIFEKLSRETWWMDLLVETQVDWNEFRLTVTRNWFFAAAHRSFPYIVWDWESTIEELVEEINYVRENKRENCLCRIWLDNEARRYLTKKWINPLYVPKIWEQVFLRSNSNVSTWASCIDMTDIVNPYYKEIAFEILNSFPWLPYIWIDLITKDITKKSDYNICELNPAPWISLHTHPSSWQSRNLPKYIVDMLYPETTFKTPSWEIISKDFRTIKDINDGYKNKYNNEYFFKPVHLELELTHKCNLLCNECAIKDDVIKWEFWLDADIISKMLNEVSKLWFYSYSITWWEPFLRFEDMLKIIDSENTMDCYKIQTNWIFFKDHEITQINLMKLKDSGFWRKNTLIKSSLRCSVWIQDWTWIKTLSRVRNLVNCFYNVFNPDIANFSIVLTHDLSLTQTEAIVEFRNSYLKEFWEDFPSDIAIRTLFIHKNDWIWSNWFKSKLDNLLYNFKYSWNCFEHDETPWPRLLVRADWDVYSCSCFSHNFKLWNIRTDSFRDMIDRANNNEILRIIENTWVIWLYEKVKLFDPEIENLEVDENIAMCDICKILKGKYELNISI